MISALVAGLDDANGRPAGARESSKTPRRRGSSPSLALRSRATIITGLRAKERPQVAKRRASRGTSQMKRIVLAAALTAFANAAASAQEVTLKAITAFAENTTYSRPFERFIARVNEAGKGLVRINYIGGPKAMPPFEVGNALKGGVVD